MEKSFEQRTPNKEELNPSTQELESPEVVGPQQEKTDSLSSTNPTILGNTNGVYNNSGKWNFYNGIIDGSKAPFNLEERVASDYLKMVIEDQAELAKCIFDSTKATLKENFGKDKKIFFSVDNKDIKIDGLDTINKNLEY